jgi:Uma2 family endonuclease
MSPAFPLHRYTYDDYVALEQDSPIKHEFFQGEIVAMAGGTPEHAAMAASVIRQLGNRLEGGRCRVFSSDLGIRVVESDFSTYPDVSVVCGATQRDSKKPTSVTNPTVVVEVTSDSTEHYDRGEKLAQYQKIPSLEAVVIVSHRQPGVELWTRDASGWRRTETLATGHLEIAPIACALDVDAIYRAAVEPGMIS